MRVVCLLNVRFRELQINMICLSHEQCKVAAMEARKSSDNKDVLPLWSKTTIFANGWDSMGIHIHSGLCSERRTKNFCWVSLLLAGSSVMNGYEWSWAQRSSVSLISSSQSLQMSRNSRDCLQSRVIQRRNTIVCCWWYLKRCLLLRGHLASNSS